MSFLKQAFTYEDVPTRKEIRDADYPVSLWGVCIHSKHYYPCTIVLLACNARHAIERVREAVQNYKDVSVARDGDVRDLHRDKVDLILSTIDAHFEHRKHTREDEEFVVDVAHADDHGIFATDFASNGGVLF